MRKVETLAQSRPETGAASPVVQALGLVKYYRHFPVLQGVDLEVYPGECFLLTGANGAGKTTLLRILATLLRPTRGSLRLLGQDGAVRGESLEAIRRQSFLVGHGNRLYDELTALENLRFFAGLRDLDLSASRASEVLEAVGLLRFGDFKVRHFSAGMKQRLVFAKVLLASPRLLLLDEPYTALDAAGVRLVNRCVSSLVEAGGSAVMVTHNRRDAESVARRGGVLRNGRLFPLEPQ